MTDTATRAPRQHKVGTVAEIGKRLQSADAVFVSEYGMTVKDITDLRNSLRGSGAEHTVYKNTLARFAQPKPGGGLNEILIGPTALTFVAGDVAAAAKAPRRSKANRLVVKGGVLGETILSASDVALADLPISRLLAVSPARFDTARQDRRTVAGNATQLRLRPCRTYRQRLPKQPAINNFQTHRRENTMSTKEEILDAISNMSVIELKSFLMPSKSASSNRCSSCCCCRCPCSWWWRWRRRRRRGQLRRRSRRRWWPEDPGHQGRS